MYVDYDLTLFQNFSYFSNPTGDQITPLDDEEYLGERLFGALSVFLTENQLLTAGVDLRSDASIKLGL